MFGLCTSVLCLHKSTIATSSTHTEYITTTEAAKELVWLHRLLTKLQEGVSGLTTLHIDNCATDLLARNPVNHAVTKHIDVQYHYIRECITDGSIKLRLIRTNDMAANVLTKSVINMKHKHFCLMLSMETLSWNQHMVLRLWGSVEDVGCTVQNHKCYAQECHWQDVPLWQMSWHTFTVCFITAWKQEEWSCGKDKVSFISSWYIWTCILTWGVVSNNLWYCTQSTASPDF